MPQYAIGLMLSLMMINGSIFASKADFYTLIGPDGRPIVVPSDQKHLSTEAKTLPKQRSDRSVKSSVASPMPIVQPIQQSSRISAQPSAAVTRVADASAQNPPVAVGGRLDQQSNVGVAEIDGERYVDSNYLELKQFNLDGKKRFYQIRDSQGHFTNTIERQAGIQLPAHLSGLNQPKKSYALSSQYKILDRTVLEQGLAQRCFSQSQLNDAVALATGKSVTLWPKTSSPTTNPQFQVVALTPNIQTILVTSYATQRRAVEFYWPMAVFLDQSGCILEGVSTYFNQSYAETPLHFASLEGMLQVPRTTKYLLLTPLEQAVDLPTTRLSPQGQLRLTVIR